MVRPAGAGFEAPSRLDKQASKPFAHRGESPVQPPVARKLDEAPCRESGEDAPAYPRQDDFEIALNDIVGRFDRVRVVAEGDEHRDVDRKPLHLVDDIERLAGRRGPFPSALHPSRDGFDVGIELLQASLRKRRHREPALRAPGGAFGVEHALDADFR